MIDLPPVTVPTPAAASTITTTTVRRRPFWVLLANGVSVGVAVLLAVLDYLQTVSLNGVLSPAHALAWVVGINVLTIVLRSMAKPTVTQTTVTPDAGGQP